MTESHTALKWVVVFAFIVVFCMFIGQWNPSAPQMSGWDDFNDQVNSDPFAGMPELQTMPLMPCGYGEERNEDGVCVPLTQQDCDPWDVPCHLRNLSDQVARAIAWVFMWIGTIFIWFFLSLVQVILYIVYGIVWIIQTMIGFFGALIMMAGGFGGTMPESVNNILLIIFVPFLAIVILMILKLLRGTS